MSEPDGSKTLAKGEVRFVVKPRSQGRHTIYQIYDRVRGSIPVISREYGKVAQDHTTEAAAQAEADRLNAQVTA